MSGLRLKSGLCGRRRCRRLRLQRSSRLLKGARDCSQADYKKPSEGDDTFKQFHHHLLSSKLSEAESRHLDGSGKTKDPASRREQGRSELCGPISYLSSKAKMSTGVVGPGLAPLFSGAYRCGTALDFDQLPLLGL